MTHLLLIDDDLELCELLQEYLVAEGFTVDLLHDGRAALKVVQSAHYDLVILDVMLPGQNGFEVLKSFRESTEIPVLMLTAKGDDVDKIVGLEMGADDYQAKPCNPRELVARVRAILRRVENSTEQKDRPVLRADQLEIYLLSREVMLAGEPLELTSSEYNILECLIKNRGIVLSKADLTEQALHKKLEAFDRSLDMHVSNLRNKIGKNSQGEQYIKTIRGVGYMLNSNDFSEISKSSQASQN